MEILDQETTQLVVDHRQLRVSPAGRVWRCGHLQCRLSVVFTAVSVVVVVVSVMFLVCPSGSPEQSRG